jgi:hypothetical protein
MKKTLFLLLLLPLLGRGLGGGCLFAQNVTVTNLQVTEGTPSTVTFDVSWEKPAPGTVWMDSAWVFVDYNKNGKMARLPVSGGTLTSHTANTGVSPDAGKLIILTGNDRGAWVTGGAWTDSPFSATVQLYTDEPNIAGACAYASGYPPVSNWIDDTKLGFTGTPMYEITLTLPDGSATVTVEAGSTFLLPCSYTMSSFTDRTGAPGIINCAPATFYNLTASATAYCAGGSVTFALENTTSGLTYQLYKNDVAVDMLTGTGGAGTFTGAFAGAGNYAAWVEAEGIHCATQMSGTYTVSENSTPGVPTTGGGGSQCGGTMNITATPGGNGGTGIRWTDGSGTSTSPTRTVGNGTYYAVTTTDAGCESGLSLPVTVTILQAGSNGQPATACGCVTGTTNCSNVCRTNPVLASSASCYGSGGGSIGPTAGPTNATECQLRCLQDACGSVYYYWIWDTYSGCFCRKCVQ